MSLRRCFAAAPPGVPIAPWALPLHLVPKEEDGWTPCGDYRALKARSVPDQYPVRHIADFAHQLAGRKVFSTMNLVKAYDQIPVHPDDIAKTAIITPFRLFEFAYVLRAPKCRANISAVHIHDVLRDLDFCYAYIDDVLVAST